jgi:hypothetical protein
MPHAIGRTSYQRGTSRWIYQEAHLQSSEVSGKAKARLGVRRHDYSCRQLVEFLLVEIVGMIALGFAAGIATVAAPARLARPWEAGLRWGIVLRQENGQRELARVPREHGLRRGLRV